MPRYTIKLNTYDPEIVKAFERLRKSRKQAAFTHEALKHFLLSEIGKEVIDLMCKEDLQLCPPVCKGREAEDSAKERQITVTTSSVLDRLSSSSGCDDILEKILG